MQVRCTSILNFFNAIIFLGARPDFVQQSAVGKNSDQDPAAVIPFTPSKIILTGEKKKTMHKEELTMSETERVVKTRTEHHAAVMQKRRSGEGAKKMADKEAKVAKQQVCVTCTFRYVESVYTCFRSKRKSGENIFNIVV